MCTRTFPVQLEGHYRAFLFQVRHHAIAKVILEYLFLFNVTISSFEWVDISIRVMTEDMLSCPAGEREREIRRILRVNIIPDLTCKYQCTVLVSSRLQEEALEYRLLMSLQSYRHRLETEDALSLSFPR